MNTIEQTLPKMKKGGSGSPSYVAIRYIFMLPIGSKFTKADLLERAGYSDPDHDGPKFGVKIAVKAMIRSGNIVEMPNGIYQLINTDNFVEVEQIQHSKIYVSVNKSTFESEQKTDPVSFKTVKTVDVLKAINAKTPEIETDITKQLSRMTAAERVSVLKTLSAMVETDILDMTSLIGN